MNVATQIQLNKQLTSKLTKISMICGALIVSNLLLSAIAFRQDLRVLLVPTHLNRELMTTVGSISEEHLELITRDYIALMLNITPDNFEYAKTEILRNTHPSTYGDIKHELSELEKDIKGRNVAINFSPTDMVIDKRNLKADVTGYKETKIGLALISRKLHKYRITYEFIGSLIRLKEFYEVKDESL